MLAQRHPKELDQLRRQLEVHDRGEGVAAYLDRYGRKLEVGCKVVTGRGEVGRIKRIDVSSERALVELPDGRTRMLRTSRLELRRGRPRRGSYAAAIPTVREATSAS